MRRSSPLIRRLRHLPPKGKAETGPSSGEKPTDVNVPLHKETNASPLFPFADEVGGQLRRLRSLPEVQAEQAKALAEEGE